MKSNLLVSAVLLTAPSASLGVLAEKASANRFLDDKIALRGANTNDPASSVSGEEALNFDADHEVLGAVASTLSNLADGELFSVQISYDVATDCGLKPDAVINGQDNNLKEGLEAAVAAISTKILNANTLALKSTRLPRLYIPPPRFRDTVYLGHNRNLAHFDAANPVTTDSVLEKTYDCPGNNCLLIISTITVVLDEDDDQDTVRSAIVDGFKASVDDGSFAAAVPSSTMICPERGES